MSMELSLVLACVAGVLSLVSAAGKIPLWPAVFVLVLAFVVARFG